MANAPGQPSERNRIMRRTISVLGLATLLLAAPAAVAQAASGPSVAKLGHCAVC